MFNLCRKRIWIQTTMIAHSRKFRTTSLCQNMSIKIAMSNRDSTKATSDNRRYSTWDRKKSRHIKDCFYVQKKSKFFQKKQTNPHQTMHCWNLQVYIGRILWIRFKWKNDGSFEHKECSCWDRGHYEILSVIVEAMKEVFINDIKRSCQKLRVRSNGSILYVS